MKAVVFPVLLCLTAAKPTPWTRTNMQLDANHVVKPIFMLKHLEADVRKLEETVAAVSTPSSASYGKYLSMNDLRSALPPVAGATEAVLEFLEKFGIPESSISVSADMISATIPALKAQEMFSTRFHEYASDRANQSIVRAKESYRLPAHLEQFVDMVGNLNEFPSIRSVIHVESKQESSLTDFGTDCGRCRGKVTPKVLADAYRFNISDRPEVSKGDTGMATAEFQGQYYDAYSIQYFGKDCSLPYEVHVQTQVGKNLESHCRFGGGGCTEALLDLEYIKATGGSIPLTNVYSDEYSLLDWAKTVDGLGDTGPAVHSISYGDDEIQQGENDAPPGMTGLQYAQAVNLQFAKLAARGISIIVASGDQAVWGRTGEGQRFHPDFPSSSPYVTSVGGTDFLKASQVGEEKAWYSGGGGFSDFFARPSWQDDAVNAYISSNAGGAGLPEASRFNKSGRAYPDVAALGGEQNPFCVASKMYPGVVESMGGVAGTSASTPVFAGLVARLNSARIAKGMPRMGLLNPWIYENAKAFNDVVHGDNGFKAAPGWDPTTGVGTPRFDAMLAAALRHNSVTETVVV